MHQIQSKNTKFIGAGEQRKKHDAEQHSQTINLSARTSINGPSDG
jgi:hypothetical protein